MIHIIILIYNSFHIHFGFQMHAIKRFIKIQLKIINFRILLPALVKRIAEDKHSQLSIILDSRTALCNQTEALRSNQKAASTPFYISRFSTGAGHSHCCLRPSIFLTLSIYWQSHTNGLFKGHAWKKKRLRVTSEAFLFYWTFLRFV